MFQEHSPVQTLHHYVIACAVAIIVFLLLLLLVTLVPVVSHWDALASGWLQHFRTSALDHFMLISTLLADGFVVAPIAVSLLAFLLAKRRWWLAFHMLSVFLTAIWAVSIIKSVVARTRPEALAGSLDNFSFPSGHATSAAVIMGVIAVLLAYRRKAFARNTIYLTTGLIAVTISFSRVYLLAHWPSDVLAGLALGFALVTAFAWQLHSGVTLQVRGLLTVVVLSSVAAAAVHIHKTLSLQAITYGVGI